MLLIGGDGGYSGVPRYILQMVRALREEYDLTVVSDQNTGGYDHLRGSGARHLTVEGLRTSGSPLRAIRALRGLREIVQNGQYDLVWAHSRMAVFLLRFLLLERALGMTRGDKPQFAITHHSLPFEEGMPRLYGAFLRIVEMLMIRIVTTHHIFFLSEIARLRYVGAISAKALRRHHLHVLTNCSDLDPLAPLTHAPETPRFIVMTGRDSYQKNLIAAVEIFAHLPPCYRLVLCGAGTDHPDFQAKVTARLRADQLNRVVLRGPVADIRPELARASAYLLTSHYEGVPIGALEAWEAGLPVALPKIDGTADILSHHPLSAALSLTDPASDALHLDMMVSRYLSEQAVWQIRIQREWAARYSFTDWAERMRAKVSSITSSC
ncbi:MAG: glycosyltransferase [Rhodobacterales bacterium]